MADSLADGRTRVGYAASIAAQALPTVAELNAGLLLTALITPDGLIGLEPSTADVPTDSLLDTYDTVDAGRISFSGTMLRMKKQTASDTAYTTLGLLGVTGFIVVRRDMAAATAWASSQVISVYPIKTGEVRDLAPEKNAVRKYEVPLKIYIAPSIHAAVA